MRLRYLEQPIGSVFARLPAVAVMAKALVARIVFAPRIGEPVEIRRRQIQPATELGVRG